jgi:hypothetical protein
MSQYPHETKDIIVYYEEFLSSIKTNIINDTQKRDEFLDKIEEMYLHILFLIAIILIFSEKIQESIEFYKDKNINDTQAMYDIGYNNLVDAQM